MEVWRGEELAGGLYGVSIGGFFAGESMFSAERDASKVALVSMVEKLRAAGFVLFDVQLMTPHLRIAWGQSRYRARSTWRRLAAAATAMPRGFSPE